MEEVRRGWWVSPTMMMMRPVVCHTRPPEAGPHTECRRRPRQEGASCFLDMRPFLSVSMRRRVGVDDRETVGSPRLHGDVDGLGAHPPDATREPPVHELEHLLPCACVFRGKPPHGGMTHALSPPQKDGWLLVGTAWSLGRRRGIVSQAALLTKQADLRLVDGQLVAQTLCLLTLPIGCLPFRCCALSFLIGTFTLRCRPVTFSCSPFTFGCCPFAFPFCTLPLHSRPLPFLHRAFLLCVGVCIQHDLDAVTPLGRQL